MTEEVPATIQMTGVTVQTPATGSTKSAGTTLVRELTCEIKAGGNVLVVGPSGVGKTSVFRVLAGLWPTTTGVIVPRPGTAGRRHMCFLPQTPYCPLGSLVDLLTYPGSDCGLSQSHLCTLLASTDLEHLLVRDASAEDWDGTLSLGAISME